MGSLQASVNMLLLCAELLTDRCVLQVIESDIIPFCLSLDTMYAKRKGFFDFIFNDNLLTTIASIVGEEITLSPIQHCRPVHHTQRTMYSAQCTMHSALRDN